ncbi:hypothetical protein BH18ACI1_BH18ACI1_18380 [soil metagenome]
MPAKHAEDAKIKIKTQKYFFLFLFSISRVQRVSRAKKNLKTMDNETIISLLYVFVLAAFLGYLVISKVPPLLHTPLMSATNAISGISVVGAIVLAGSQHDLISTVLGVIAVISATINVVGGFMITDRMLRMFQDKTGKKDKT